MPGGVGGGHGYFQEGRDVSTPEGEDPGRHISDFNLIWFIATIRVLAEIEMPPEMQDEIGFHVSDVVDCREDVTRYVLLSESYPRNRILRKEEVLAGRLIEG